MGRKGLEVDVRAGDVFSAPSFYLPTVLKRTSTSASLVKAQCDGIVLSQGLSKPSSVREGQRSETCWLLLGWRQCPQCLVLLPATEHLDSLCFIKSGGKKQNQNQNKTPVSTSPTRKD